MQERWREAEEDPGQTGSPLQAGETQFLRLLDKLPAAAYTCDPEGLITYFNRHALELWGRAPKLNDPEDRFCGSFRLLSPAGSPIAHDQCWMALALRMDREYNGHEIVVERPDGSWVTALAHANPIRDESGRQLGAVNVLVDISERKRAEDLLKEADRHKNEFLATLSHELRNPLAPIRNAVGVLQLKGPPSPELRWALGIIDRQMRRMTRLVDDLLDLSRIANGKLKLRKERVELADVLQSAVETSRPLVEQCGLQLIVTLPPEPIVLDGDSTRLSQVFSNLLDNAAKFTEPGGHVSLTTERDGDELVVSVKDDGVGIPAEMLPRIFEIFAQLDCSRESTPEGLGIGLTLVRRLIEMHGGIVEAHSAGPGQGSEFIVRLPIVVEGVEIARPSRSPGDATQVAAPPRRRILVVDDNEDGGDSLATFLRILGNEVRIALDGLEAVEVAADFQPDVVLLDIGLPKLNGYEAARRIRAQDFAGASLIALTGWGQEEDRRRSREAGFDHHLVKPVDLDALRELLASLKPSRVPPPERCP